MKLGALVHQPPSADGVEPGRRTSMRSDEVFVEAVPGWMFAPLRSRREGVLLEEKLGDVAPGGDRREGLARLVLFVDSLSAVAGRSFLFVFGPRRRRPREGRLPPAPLGQPGDFQVAPSAPDANWPPESPVTTGTQ